MLRILCALFIAALLSAQDPGPFIDLPGGPRPQEPVCAEQEGPNVVLYLGYKQILLENFKFKKPWFGSWQITFSVRNRTEHNLEALALQFVFINKAGEAVSEPHKAPGYRIANLTDSETATLPVKLTIPADLRPEKSQDVAGVNVYLVSLKARMNRDDILRAEREKERKAYQERQASLKAEQERTEAETQARHEREAAERAAVDVAGQAKRDASQRALEAAKRRQQESETRGIAKDQEPVTKAAAAPMAAVSLESPEEGGAACLGVFLLVGFAFGLLGIAYANSNASKARRAARNSTATVEQLGRAIDRFKGQASEKVRLAARNYVVGVQVARLVAIPLDELKRMAPGVRLQLLKSQGYDNLSHLQGVTAQSLMSIKGIGPDSASRITAAAGTLISASNRLAIPVPLPGEANGPERALLEANYMQYRVNALLADPSGLLAARLKTFRSQVVLVVADSTFWTWLTSRGEGPTLVAASNLAQAMRSQVSDGPTMDPVIRNLRCALAEAEAAIRNAVPWSDMEKDITARMETYHSSLVGQLTPGHPAGAPPAVVSKHSPPFPGQNVQALGHDVSVRIELISSGASTRTTDSDRMWRWLPAGQEIAVCGFRIPGGMIYIGENPTSFSGGGREASLVNPNLPVNAAAADCRVRRTNYWPSYDAIAPEARASYLQWLADGRCNPEADIGYVFLYFYGLERRVLIDAPSNPAAKAEIPGIETEITRLLGIYKASGSFCSYATSLLDYLSAARGEVGNQPSLDWGIRGLNVGQKIALGKLAVAGEPIPPETACQWFLSEPTSRRRNSLERCPDQFRAAFVVEFTRQFPGGFQLPRNKTMLKVSHRAASASLNSGVHSVDLPVPDVSVLGSSIQKIQAVGDAVGDALEPFSRFLGRNPGQEKSLDAILLLPKHFWPEPVLAPLNNLAEEIRASDRPLVMPFLNLQILLPEGADFNKTRYGVLCRALEGVGLGIEPDVQFGGTVPDLKDPIALFTLSEQGEIKGPSSGFTSGALLVHLASTVAGADGDFGEAEAKLLMVHINQGLALPEHETQRLQARLELFRRVPPSITGLKRKVESLPPNARKAIGDFLVHVVHADGVVEPDEVRTLEKAFKLLGLEAGSLYSQLHGAAAEPITVRPATEAGPTFRVPTAAPKPFSGSAIKLDMAKVAALKEDSIKVAALLGSIFTETPSTDHVTIPVLEPEPLEGDRACNLPLLGLDPEHEGLLRSLLGRPQWSRIELEEMCADRGLMVDGAIERINEAAFDRYDHPLLEGEDPLDINIELTLEEAV